MDELQQQHNVDAQSSPILLLSANNKDFLLKRNKINMKFD